MLDKNVVLIDLTISFVTAQISDATLFKVQ